MDAELSWLSPEVHESDQEADDEQSGDGVFCLLPVVSPGCVTVESPVNLNYVKARP
jgi:hypothetical protein